MPPTKCESFGEKQSMKTRVSQVRWEKTGTKVMEMCLGKCRCVWVWMYMYILLHWVSACVWNCGFTYSFTGCR